MFFFLSKVLAFLAMPLTIIILLIVIGFVVKKQPVKRFFMSTGIATLLFFTNPWIYSQVLAWWETPPINYVDLQETYQVGVVLTGMLSLDALPEDRIHFNHSSDRIHHAIELYQRGVIEKILISGGAGTITKPIKKEAPRLRNFAISCGVKQEDIWVEDVSRNTFENAKYSKYFLDSAFTTMPKIVLITSAFHMRRSSACFSKQEVNHLPFPTGYQTHPRRGTPDEWIIPSTEALRWWHVLFKEWLGIAAYKTAGYI